MDYGFYLGIDVSKLTFDYALLDSGGTVLGQGKVDNRPAAIRAWAGEMAALLQWRKTLVCMEHSGYYGAHLLNALHTEKANIWVESALRIKRSIGLQRGKSDRADALRIATYCLDFQRKAELWRPTGANIERLGLLLSHRDRLVRNLQSVRNPLEEEKGFVDSAHHEEAAAITAPVVKALEGAIKGYGTKIKELLDSDGQLARQAEIISSIPGFSKVITPKLIEVTRGFTRLTDPRQLACYAGIAPFEHSSGTSVKGRTRVSHLANKDIKKMLHLAALVTIRKGNIMHAYYQRKVGEGKSPMTVINAVRNKLVHILLACIRKDVMYEKNYEAGLG